MTETFYSISTGTWGARERERARAANTHAHTERESFRTIQNTRMVVQTADVVAHRHTRSEESHVIWIIINFLHIVHTIDFLHNSLTLAHHRRFAVTINLPVQCAVCAAMCLRCTYIVQRTQWSVYVFHRTTSNVALKSHCFPFMRSFVWSFIFTRVACTLHTVHWPRFSLMTWEGDNELHFCANFLFFFWSGLVVIGFVSEVHWSGRAFGPCVLTHNNN